MSSPNPQENCVIPVPPPMPIPIPPPMPIPPPPPMPPAVFSRCEDEVRNLREANNNIQQLLVRCGNQNPGNASNQSLLEFENEYRRLLAKAERLNQDKLKTLRERQICMDKLVEVIMEYDVMAANNMEVAHENRQLRDTVDVLRNQVREVGPVRNLNQAFGVDESDSRPFSAPLPPRNQYQSPRSLVGRQAWQSSAIRSPVPHRQPSGCPGALDGTGRCTCCSECACSGRRGSTFASDSGFSNRVHSIMPGGRGVNWNNNDSASRWTVDPSGMRTLDVQGVGGLRSPAGHSWNVSDPSSGYAGGRTTDGSSPEASIRSYRQDYEARGVVPASMSDGTPHSGSINVDDLDVSDYAAFAGGINYRQDHRSTLLEGRGGVRGGPIRGIGISRIERVPIETSSLRYNPPRPPPQVLLDSNGVPYPMYVSTDSSRSGQTPNGPCSNLIPFSSTPNHSQGSQNSNPFANYPQYSGNSSSDKYASRFLLDSNGVPYPQYVSTGESSLGGQSLGGYSLQSSQNSNPFATYPQYSGNNSSGNYSSRLLLDSNGVPYPQYVSTGESSLGQSIGANCCGNNSQGSQNSNPFTTYPQLSDMSRSGQSPGGNASGSSQQSSSSGNNSILYQSNGEPYPVYVSSDNSGGNTTGSSQQSSSSGNNSILYQSNGEPYPVYVSSDNSGGNTTGSSQQSGTGTSGSPQYASSGGNASGSNQQGSSFSSNSTAYQTMPGGSPMVGPTSPRVAFNMSSPRGAPNMSLNSTQFGGMDPNFSGNMSLNSTGYNEC